MKAVRGVVKGLVQGVGFRFFTRAAAERLGLKGWVKNLVDSEVEFFAQGGDQGIKALVSEIQKGPPGSRVDQVNAADAPPEPGLSRFEIRHDY